MPGFVPGHNHRRFLAAAVEDTLRWCAQADITVVGSHPTYQHWIKAFTPTAGIVSAATPRRFLDTIKVINVACNYYAVAKILNDLLAATDFDPVHGIARLAKTLRRANKQVSASTAVASKLAHCMFPAAEVYIWHNLSRRSVLFQEQNLLEYDIDADGPVTCDHEDEDYASFHAAYGASSSAIWRKKTLPTPLASSPTCCEQFQGRSRIRRYLIRFYTAASWTSSFSMKAGTSSTVKLLLTQRLRKAHPYPRTENPFQVGVGS